MRRLKLWTGPTCVTEIAEQFAFALGREAQVYAGTEYVYLTMPQDTVVAAYDELYRLFQATNLRAFVSTACDPVAWR